MDEDLAERAVLWRCRRGMKELDVLLERFVRERYAGSSAAQKRAFARFLELPDPDLAAYLFGHETPGQPDLAEIARLITAGRPD